MSFELSHESEKKVKIKIIIFVTFHSFAQKPPVDKFVPNLV